MLCPTGMLNWQISLPAAAQALHAEQRANAFFVANRRMPNQIHVFFFQDGPKVEGILVCLSTLALVKLP